MLKVQRVAQLSDCIGDWYAGLYKQSNGIKSRATRMVLLP
jgi:hypothetical protein